MLGQITLRYRSSDGIELRVRVTVAVICSSNDLLFIRLSSLVASASYACGGPVSTSPPQCPTTNTQCTQCEQNKRLTDSHQGADLTEGENMSAQLPLSYELRRCLERCRPKAARTACRISIRAANQLALPGSALPLQNKSSASPRHTCVRSCCAHAWQIIPPERNRLLAIALRVGRNLLRVDPDRARES